MKTNIKPAVDQYIMWLKNYPNDFKGAVEAASDFLDTLSDVT
jgi:hypothetical protein